MQNRDGVEWTVRNEAGDAWKEPIDVETLSYPCHAAGAQQHQGARHKKCFAHDIGRVHDCG